MSSNKTMCEASKCVNADDDEQLSVVENEKAEQYDNSAWPLHIRLIAETFVPNLLFGQHRKPL